MSSTRARLMRLQTGAHQLVNALPIAQRIVAKYLLDELCGIIGSLLDELEGRTQGAPGGGPARLTREV